MEQSANQEKTTSVELGDLMEKLEQIEKKLKYSEGDRQELKREVSPGKGDGREATADFGQGRRYRQRASERNISRRIWKK